MLTGAAPSAITASRDQIASLVTLMTCRCKGILFTNESPDTRFALQVVGRRVEIMELGEWGERTKQSRLVAIGSLFDAEELNSKFEACTNPRRPPLG